MKIKLFDDNFTICKIQDLTEVCLSDEFVFLSKTDEEISLVCKTELCPSVTFQREDGWKALRIQGQMDFSLVGVLANITGIIANEGIGLFAVSTYNTDYVLTKIENFEKAVLALIENGYVVDE